MQTLNDPNVLYGGDPEEANGPLNGGFASLGELILSDLKEGGDRTSFINGKTDKSCTFQDFRNQTITLARTLFGEGLRKNDAIAIISENRLEFPAISFGTLCLNAIVLPINVTYTERELKHALNLAKPKFVFVSPYASKKTIKTCKNLNYVKKVILIEGKTVDQHVVSMKDLIRKHEKDQFNIEDHVCSELDIHDQVALILCSSGTTGMPKGVQITQANLMSCLQTYRELFVLMRMIHDQDTIAMNVAPWFHSLGFVAMFMVACSRNATYVFLPKFEEEVFLRSIEKYKVNILTVVPPIMVLLAKSPLVDKYDLSSVKDIGCGAAALSKEVEDQVRERLNGNVIIRQGYGMSETTLGTLSAVMIIKPGSVGQPVKGIYAKVVDENGKSLGPNHKGELCFKGDRMMKGYIGDKKATDDTIDEDGWLHSGDIGYYDEDLQFFIVDRLKELIKYKAFQVPPAEIEGVLLSHPKIKDCGVIGIPDEDAGELPFAYVVKQPGITLSEKEVIDFVAEHSSKAKRLHGGVKFIHEIPKNLSGKLLRRELRELYKSTKSKL